MRRVLIELAGGKENSQAWDLSLFKIASFRTGSNSPLIPCFDPFYPMVPSKSEFAPDLNVAVDLAPLPDDPGRIPRQRVRSQPLPPLGSPVPTFELNQCWYRIGYTFFNLPASHALDLGPDDPAEPESWVRSWCPPANPANIPMGCPPGLNLNRIVSVRLSFPSVRPCSVSSCQVSPSFHVERGELLGLEFDSPMPANPIYEDKPDPFPSICWTIWYRSALSEKYKVPTVVFMDQVEDNWLAIARTAVPGIGFECEVLFDD